FGIYVRCNGTSKLNPLRNYYYFDSLDSGALLTAESIDKQPRAAFLSPAQRRDPETRALNIHAISPYEWFAPWSETSYGKRPPDYEALKSRYAGVVLDFVESHQSGFKSSIERFATSTPVANQHFNGSAEGSPYGIYHSMENTGARALGPNTRVRNLLITGQSSLFPGLLGAASSGLRTSGHIIGIKPALKELRQLGGEA
ncbi:MAG: hypothetical protein ABL958_18790, partial [Bdellovibrionia bacterium]